MSNPSDYSASVLARLLNHSRSHKENYQSVLIRYVIERFLYRLGQSEYKDSFLLKGAQLLTITFETLQSVLVGNCDYPNGLTDGELMLPSTIWSRITSPASDVYTSASLVTTISLLPKP